MKVINEINPSKWYTNKNDFTKFLSEFDYTYMDRSKPKGPDYIIMDDFINLFALDKSDLFNAKNEAEILT